MQFRQSPVALALLLALSPAVIIPTYANAAETLYESTTDKTQRGERFKQALQTAKDGDTIKLEGNTSLLRGEGYLTINKNITIDGNGHQLHIEGSNLSLEADVTIKNTNLSLKASQTLDNIFGGGFNTQNATPSVIVTNGHKLVLDAVDTKVSGEHDDSRPIIILGSKDNSTQNAGHGELVVTNSNYKTKLYAVVAGGNGTNDQNQSTKITLEKGVSFVDKKSRGTDEGVIVGTFNGKNYTGNVDLIIGESNTNLKTFDTATNPNVSLTLTNGLPGDGILKLGENGKLKNLTLDGSKNISVENLTVTDTLTLRNGAVLQTPNFPKTASQINLNNVNVERGEIKAEEKSGKKANLTISGHIDGDLKITGNDVKLSDNYQLNSNGIVEPKTSTPPQPQTPPTDSSQGETNQGESNQSETNQGETGQGNESTNGNEQGHSNEVTPPTTEPESPAQPEEPVVPTQPEQPPAEPVQPPAEPEQPTDPVVLVDPIEPPATPSEPADNSQGENGTDENNSGTTTPAPDAPTAGEETPPSTTPENGNNTPNVEPPEAETPNTGEDPNNANATDTPSENNGTVENNGTAESRGEAENNGTTENSGAVENTENQQSKSSATEQPAEETAQEAQKENNAENIESKENAQASATVETAPKNTALSLISTAEIAYHQSSAKAVYALMVSSQAMNGINKRLNQLRAYDSHQDLSAALDSAAVPFTGESGLWVSAQSQRLKQHQDYKLRHWGVQIGYDATLPIESGLLRLGGAVDMANGQIRLTESRDELRLRDYGAALYGSYETEKGQHIDAIARAARISVKNPVQHFRYHHNLYSASVAYGQRFQLTPYWVLDPYGQLAYHHLSATDYHQNHVMVKRDAVNSLVASLGVKSAVQIKPNVQLYVDAALYRELAGKQKLFLTHDAAPADILRQDWNNHATWGVVGVGIQAKWTPNFHWSTELNHVIGNGYKQSYQAQVNINWLF